MRLKVSPKFDRTSFIINIGLSATDCALDDWELKNFFRKTVAGCSEYEVFP